MRAKRPDRVLLLIVLTLIVVGFAIFMSASLGQMGRDSASFTTVALKQLGVLLSGLILTIVFANTPYRSIKPYSPYLFALAVVLTGLVFVPGLGFVYGGAKRWLLLGPFTIQPSEFLKFTFIIFLAAWASVRKDRLQSLSNGFLPFLIFLGIVGGLMLLQPDTGTLMVIVAGALGIFVAAGGHWRHLFLLFLLGIVAVGLLAFTRPYVRDRIETFLNPKHDVTGSSYQINQSLIAIGSGGLMGRGFGQSVQKFNFLPQPIGDSIFAVASEEFGLLGASLLVFLYLAFAIWGLKIMSKVIDPFGRLLGTGLIVLITSQAFINIGAMLGLLPLTGVPLPFISHGGTALLFALIGVGIILNISKNETKI
ncbi:MAG: putative peptidoglycan glycosyltransferase FtsW [Candidatus Paceibacterota bacterium]|jgi:cell division protein FtsW